MNPHKATKDFEQALCEYTGAPYAVAVNSCTMALLLAVAWHFRNHPERGWCDGEDSGYQTRPAIEIPKRTYISVPMSIIHAGGRPTFRDEEWIGAYQLKPLPVWDSARWFTSQMYHERWTARFDREGVATERMRHNWSEDHAMVCVSFHASKTLGLEQGGAILHDNPGADAWLRRARFDGRTEGVAPKDDTFTQVGWHAYLNPSTAAQGILRLHSLPRHNEPLPNDEYPDLSTMEIFR
jgi:dTDP-4-amino-4,6-dideoxygalactose transaminase